MTSPLTARHFAEFDAVQRRRTPDAESVLAELAIRAVPRVRELAGTVLRFAMQDIFLSYFPAQSEHTDRPWPENAEYMLWRAVLQGPDLITKEEVENVKALSIEADGWWSCADCEIHFVPRETWIECYDEWLRAEARTL